MTNLQSLVETLFAPQGDIAKRLASFKYRESQTEMAQAIAEAIANQSILLAEAGTGTGKTFAYLAPAMLDGRKTIISTASKTLQDQLFLRDIPQLKSILAQSLKIALLKGRANYICRYYLQRANQQPDFQSRTEISQLKTITKFAGITIRGDKAECSQVPENAPIWQQVTSSAENCLGSDCDYYRDCFVMQARKEALEADLVIVNHHLFFADLALRGEGVAELLPQANNIIFDEAHQIPSIASQFFGNTLSTRQWLELARDSLVAGHESARETVDWITISRTIEQAIRELRASLPVLPTNIDATDLAQHSVLVEKLNAVNETLVSLAKALEPHAVRTPSLQNCFERATLANEQLTNWLTQSDVDYIRWVDVLTQSVHLHLTPIDIAPQMQAALAETPRAWIFTSATLCIQGSFELFQHELGLTQANTSYWDSPFNYPEQGLMYVPAHLPLPQAPDFANKFCEAILPLLLASQGHALILCTTLRAIERYADLISEAFNKQNIDYPILIQGQQPRGLLLEKFRQTPNAILIGSHSFWEGIDVPGDALRLVAIDKLPFAPPDDPVLSVRMKKLEEQGKNPFMDYQLPAAILTLKQGVGRLIRSESDQGVLMIGDIRMISKPYGKKIWQALPNFSRTRDENIACDFLTRENTTQTDTSLESKLNSPV